MAWRGGAGQGEVRARPVNRDKYTTSVDPGGEAGSSGRRGTTAAAAGKPILTLAGAHAHTHLVAQRGQHLPALLLARILAAPGGLIAAVAAVCTHHTGPAGGGSKGCHQAGWGATRRHLRQVDEVQHGIADPGRRQPAHHKCCRRPWMS